MQEAKEYVITKDMTIGDIVAKYPHVVDTLTSYGLHCVGCHVNTMETLEQGCIGHGMPGEVFNEMLGKVNEIAINGHTIHEQTNKEVQDITLTDKAVKKVKELLTQEGATNQGLRVGVLPGGCSGFSYDLSFDEKNENDKVFEYDDLKVFVDKDHLEMLSGLQVDFIDGLHESGFKINNPNAKSTCGCGHSFS